MQDKIKVYHPLNTWYTLKDFIFDMAFHEHNKRSIAKALTFRGIILISDGIIIFLITHRYDVAFAVIVFSNLASTVLYFFHERAWNKIHWGKNAL